MEYCPGGDLEDIIRRAVLLDVNTIKIMLFQMLFAFYSCREKLCMRHFDVKLLNFFVSTGKSLLTLNNNKENNSNEKIDNENKENIQNSNDNVNNNNKNNKNKNKNSNDNKDNNDVIHMRVGFGHHIFNLPLPSNSPVLVKVRGMLLLIDLVF